MPTLHSFDYAIIRVVPRVDREEFVNAGIILFSRTSHFLAAQIELDLRRVADLAPTCDLLQLERQLAAIPRICNGDPDGGPIAQLPLSGRFHWLVSPRSTVVQTSAVHSGLCHDLEATLAHLVAAAVRTPSAGESVEWSAWQPPAHRV